VDRLAVCLHTGTNVGFAIEPLEQVFFGVGQELCGTGGVLLAYNGCGRGRPRWLNDDSVPVAHCAYAEGGGAENLEFLSMIEALGVDTVFAFDMPVASPIVPELRKAGVRSVISYWGAPMSSLNHGLKRLLKRIEVNLFRDGPDHFVFESEGMRDAAVLGRGVLRSNTSVVPLGYDPLPGVEPYPTDFLETALGIGRGRRVLFYAGHMEERKGVHVLIEAMKHLIERQERRDVHLLICGNKDGNEAPHRARLAGSKAEAHVTFAGYRSDLPRLMKSSYLGCIASTGWDSFPRTSLEMQAYGLPILVSDLPGIRETVEHGVTGYRVETGNPLALADEVARLLDDRDLRDSLSLAAVKRIARSFTAALQKQRLKDCLERESSRGSRRAASRIAVGRRREASTSGH
jgi:glycosyltransferase involved in cell wall biosynthesis